MRMPKDMEIKRLFDNFKKQVNQLKSKKNDLESSISKVKNDLVALQQKQFKAIGEVQTLVKKSVDLREKRAKLEEELKNIKEKLVKLSKIPQFR